MQNGTSQCFIIIIIIFQIKCIIIKKEHFNGWCVYFQSGGKYFYSSTTLNFYSATFQGNKLNFLLIKNDTFTLFHVNMFVL